MKQIIMKSGKILCENVPIPITFYGTILVRVNYSCISQGTELAGFQNCSKGKIEKLISIIKDKPQVIQKAIDTYKEQGLKNLKSKVDSATKVDDSSKPIGYSISGIVESVGEGISDIKMGDRVACAGAGIANHAEYVVVPRNLVTRVPNELDLKFASTVTLGGIAMQGIRRGDFRIGEFVTVIGLGFLGQLTIQMLTASGCRVIAIDIDDHRCDIAKRYGAEKVFNSIQHTKIDDEVIKYTNGYGTDGVIFTAATNNPEVISSVFKMCKKKGKVVLVGIAGDKISRQDLYTKELDFLVSTSYGPGRYDNKYELEGIDYPYAYVRWTENRNMQEYLRLLNEKQIRIEDMVNKIYNVDEAEKAYEELQNLKNKPIIALFQYPDSENNITDKKIVVHSYKKISKNIINVAIIGAGNFAKNVHLPNLMKLKDKYNIYAICDINALNSKETAKKFNANIATTDFLEILSDSNVDMVMICTRHNLHAPYAMMALKAGKAVFVEKPMAISQEELNELTTVIKETGLPFMVGFNRRFSPFAKEIKQQIKDRSNPMIISYRMNAGYAPPDAWIHEDGGRIIGEACHIIDLFTYFTNARIASISSEKITPSSKAYLAQDNVSITLKYDDGSVANLVYTSLGNSNYPKENLELYCDNKVYKIIDYKKLEIFGDSVFTKELKEADKGYYNELIVFANKVQQFTGLGESEINDFFETTHSTFLVNG